MKTLQQQIDKFTALAANCHDQRTYERLWNYADHQINADMFWAILEYQSDYANREHENRILTNYKAALYVKR